MANIPIITLNRSAVALIKYKTKVVEEPIPLPPLSFNKDDQLLSHHLINVYHLMLFLLPNVERFVKGRYYDEGEKGREGHSSDDYPGHASS